MLIFENIQTIYYLHTHKYIYIITQHAPAYTTIANTTMTHSFRNYIQWVGTSHIVKGGAFFVYIQ